MAAWNPLSDKYTILVCYLSKDAFGFGHLQSKSASWDVLREYWNWESVVSLRWVAKGKEGTAEKFEMSLLAWFAMLSGVRFTELPSKLPNANTWDDPVGWDSKLPNSKFAYLFSRTEGTTFGGYALGWVAKLWWWRSFGKAVSDLMEIGGIGIKKNQDNPGISSDIQHISSISMSTYHILALIQVWVGLSSRGLHESSFKWILSAESAKWKSRRALFAQDIFSKMTKTTQATCQNC